MEDANKKIVLGEFLSLQIGCNKKGFTEIKIQNIGFKVIISLDKDYYEPVMIQFNQKIITA